MSREHIVRTVQQLLADIGSEGEPDQIAALTFNTRFRVMLAHCLGLETGGGNRWYRCLPFYSRHALDWAVVFGALASKVNSTERVIGSPFAIILYITDGKITRFQILEDTFASSRAVRP